MANTREELVNRFFAISGVGKIQAAVGTGMANASIDTRDKCTITREEVITRRDIRDCRDEDMTDSQIVTRLGRYTLNYTEVTPQIEARWAAYFFGTAAAPTGAPANEVQTLTRSGTVSGGSFTLAMTLEGRLVTTKPIAWNATTTDIQNALTASRMLYIHPGDVVVTGDWTGMVLTFGGRLAHADLPLMVVDNGLITGGGSVAIAQTTAGAQYHHVISRSTSREKVRFTFALGYEDQTSSIEKYIDYAVESINPQASLTTDPSFQVVIIGPWDYDSLEPTLTIPDCVNPNPLRTEDCRVKVDGNFESSDVNSVNTTLNDNIPLDRLSAFPYDGIDVQTIIRGKQPSYNTLASIFGAHVDTGDALAVNNHVWKLAHEERTQSPVVVQTMYGMPGNRFQIDQPKSKVRFQNNRETFVGAAEISAVNIEALPFKDTTNPPVSAEAWIDQSTAFLTT